MSFLHNYFSERGPFEPNKQNEAPVRCPFLHSKGYDTRPSAHVNTKEGLFHCKVCQAEGRFNDGGLSEIGFIAEVYNISYEDAAELASFSVLPDNDTTTWKVAEDNFHTGTDEWKYLTTERGLTPETIRGYRLGYSGGGIGYPIFVYGDLLDVRTYDPGGKPKIRSRAGAVPLLFPFDAWVNDDRPTLYMAGENDTLLTRQLGFNALTGTSGEGNFPKTFLGLFKDKTVYVVGDCDETGRKAAQLNAFHLKEAGATVYMVDLQLSGEKDDKDLTDFVMKRGFGAAQLQAQLDAAEEFTELAFNKVRNERFPLVNLWDVGRGEYSGSRMSCRVTLAGKYDMPMQAPTAIEFRCKGSKDEEVCVSCPFRDSAQFWSLKDDNLRDLMYLVDVSEQQQQKYIYGRICKMPEKCPGFRTQVRAKQEVTKVIFTPDVETEDEATGFRSVEQYAYVLKHQLDDGARYRAFFRSYPHPLNGQRIFMIVDKVEDSDNALNTFKMTETIAEQLKVFQGDPVTMMKLRAEMAKGIVGNHASENVVYGVDLTYHGPLEMNLFGRKTKGYLEGLVTGESRTGKSSVAIPLQQFYGLGNYTAVKSATVAGLLGGADKLPSGGHKLTWGMIPRNHKGLVILDEMSGMPREVLAAMTDLRSSGTASVTKIVRGKAPAKTRMLWMSNPRTNHKGMSTALYDYPTGIHMILELVGSDEDVARFDFIVTLAAPERLTSPFEAVNAVPHEAEAYRNLIYWVWTRTAEQVRWEHNIEQYIWQVSEELNEKYNTDVKLFGPEASKKLARIAVAVAGCCFSCSDDYESIVVRKEHVDWAADWLASLYDNSLFRLADYVAEQRMYNTLDESINTFVTMLCNRHFQMIRALMQSSQPYNPNNLRVVSGMDGDQFGDIISRMAASFLIQIHPNGYTPSRRLKKAVAIYRGEYQTTRLVPLTERGAPPV